MQGVKCYYFLMYSLTFGHLIKVLGSIVCYQMHNKKELLN